MSSDASLPDTASAIEPAGAIAPVLIAPRVNAAVSEFIHEEALNADLLLRLFRQAFMPVESLSGQALLVTAESGMRLVGDGGHRPQAPGPARALHAAARG